MSELSDGVPREPEDFEPPAISATGDDVDRIWQRVDSSRATRRWWPAVAAAAAIAVMVGGAAIGLAMWRNDAVTAVDSTKVTCTSSAGISDMWVTTVPALEDTAGWRTLCGEAEVADPDGPMIADGRAITVCRVDVARYEVHIGVPRACAPTSSP